ncbi:acyloxyacyl hydrolase [Fulvivirga lutea]|uniref:Acyloxyacyl hydrolase n=1 Tax=Fulvivirga lutea TaxID=2810512 RepID=A0A975A238_9BACT|nr:acyloxyacyl hydrolase [Fulvivirga lutea]QSE99069.1 acyloxyacyl hydrolase [Fulvivirga lutea]
MRKTLFTLLILLAGFNGFSQDGEGVNRSIGLEVFRGFIYEHKPQITHLITDHPMGFRVVYNRHSHGNEAWQQRYNFPDGGLTFIYMDYRDARLGKTLALLPHFNFYLRGKREAKSQFQFKAGFGAGYTTEKYDRETNNQNNVISTDLTGAVLFQFAHQYQLSERLALNSSLSVTHFSNGAIKKPNSGINIFGANVGLHYTFDYQRRAFNYMEEPKLENRPIGYSVILIGGAHESLKIGAGTKPFFVLTGIVDKKVNHKSRFGAGLELFYSESLKEEIKYDDEVDPDTDFKRVGLVLSHEMMVNEFSIMMQAGYYVYDPYKAFQPVYVRLKLRRYFGDHIFGSIGVKSHSAKAEAMEFAIGYRIK